jgi:putative Mg2+ transporter-C (MgtC) family protein
MLVAGLIVVVNIVIRPLTNLIDRTPKAGAEVAHRFRISATAVAEGEAALRLLLLKQIAASGARLQRLDSEDLPGTNGAAPSIALTAHLVARGEATEAMEAIVGRLSLEPTITRVGWEDQDAEEE